MFVSLKKFAADLLFPIRCLDCRRINPSFICTQCLTAIPMYEKNIRPIPCLDRLIIAAPYEHSLVKRAIEAYKYAFVSELAEPLGKLMVRALTRDIWSGGGVVLAPVPLTISRMRWRGFNQAELLAYYISQVLDIPIANDLLTRTKKTRPQMSLVDVQQRWENIKGAFQISAKTSLKDKHVLLVDDVATTGATLSECARALKPLRPKAVWGLVLARG